MIAASNLTQQKRLWTALGREDMIKQNNNQRLDSHAEEAQVIAEIISTMTADYWEAFYRNAGFLPHALGGSKRHLMTLMSIPEASCTLSR
ncbi:hypothetical protein HORIV_66060 [Vreelandella olivaria]|uniref:Uncharacterized protein n=1 Tax=Vreelandella olivaria TaxID=390919 RepID=A0ABN5XBL7_9GAMM|nr:hypothetical protein HORIV_66060 [Halomonas olivaria]